MLFGWIEVENLKGDMTDTLSGHWGRSEMKAAAMVLWPISRDHRYGRKRRVG